VAASTESGPGEAVSTIAASTNPPGALGMFIARELEHRGFAVTVLSANGSLLRVGDDPDAIIVSCRRRSS
jgi:hypothetical protein